MTTPHRLLAGGLAALVTFAARPSPAVVCPADALWQLTQPVTRAVPDTPFGEGLSFYAQGSTLHAI